MRPEDTTGIAAFREYVTADLQELIDWAKILGYVLTIRVESGKMEVDVREVPE